jgi:DNA-binding response OmpR family regulator
VRILVVEDDERIAEPVAAALREQRHTVAIANDGVTALEMSAVEPPDVVVLDLMLPGVGGLEICRALRDRGSQTMVLVMTARDSLDDKVAVLDGGADDYVVKPFELEELLARIRALSRRGPADRIAVLTFREIELDQVSARAYYDGSPLELTRTEYTILEMMLRNPTRVYSSDQLSERVSKFEGCGNATAIKSHIANLRKKLRAAGCQRQVILTLYGFGYKRADA